MAILKKKEDVKDSSVRHGDGVLRVCVKEKNLEGKEVGKRQIRSEKKEGDKDRYILR